MAPVHDPSSGRNNGSNRSRPHTTNKPYSRPSQSDQPSSASSTRTRNTPSSKLSSQRDQQEGLLSGLRSFITAPLSWLTGSKDKSSSSTKSPSRDDDNNALESRQQHHQRTQHTHQQDNQSSGHPSSARRASDSADDLEAGRSSSSRQAPPPRAPLSSSSAARRYLPTSQSMPYLDAPVPDPYQRPFPRSPAQIGSRFAPATSSRLREGGLSRSTTTNFSAIDEAGDDDMSGSSRGGEQWMDRYANREDSIEPDVR